MRAGLGPSWAAGEPGLSATSYFSPTTRTRTRSGRAAAPLAGGSATREAPAASLQSSPRRRERALCRAQGARASARSFPPIARSRSMRHRAPRALLTAATLGLSLALGAHAAACAPSPDPVVSGRPPPDSSPLQRAESLDRRASALELEATHLTLEATALSRRASSLRVQASSWGVERARLLALATSIESDSASLRAAATAARTGAAKARDEAKELRRLARRPRMA